MTTPTAAYINRIATAVPGNEVHQPFIDFATDMLEDERTRLLFGRMAARAEITNRFSVLGALDPTGHPAPSGTAIDPYAFYTRGAFPNTAERMHAFERFAPPLARAALDRLHLSPTELGRITHVLVTSCTGLYAPGLDFEVVDHLGLSPSVERTMIGFMGCYAAVNALKLARHIIRSEPSSAVLILNLELCTLHFQETQSLEQVLSFLVFADGAAASLVTASPRGLALDSFHSLLIPETRRLITWNVRDLGFDMFLSGQVPAEIGRALRIGVPLLTAPHPPEEIDLWAIHPGGRSVLDAVHQSLSQTLDLAPDALKASRRTLCRFGNMSSATIMFVLAEIMRSVAPNQRGCAMSFGPGLTAETFLFHSA